jgi:hypothetical protein
MMYCQLSAGLIFEPEPSGYEPDGSTSDSLCFCTFILSVDSKGPRLCRNDILAEGEELGSNVLQCRNEAAAAAEASKEANRGRR